MADLPEFDASQIDINQVTQEYFQRIHRAALMLTGNPWDADDLAQETFMVLSKNIDKFQGRSSIYTWLYGILLNLDRRDRRRAAIRRRKLRVLWESEPEDEQTVPAAETSIEVTEWKTSLWSYVSQLPDGQRQALVLRYSEHLSYEEIAGVLECPLGTVKSRIFHAMGSLRKLLSADQEIRETPKYANEDISNVV